MRVVVEVVIEPDRVPIWVVAVEEELDVGGSPLRTIVDDKVVELEDNVGVVVVVVVVVVGDGLGVVVVVVVELLKVVDELLDPTAEEPFI